MRVSKKYYHGNTNNTKCMVVLIACNAAVTIFS